MTEGKGRAILSGWWSWYRDSVLITAVALVFSLDQVTKALVRHNLTLNESVPPDGIFRITRTFNTGSAFGLFADQTMFLILASFVGIGILLLMYRSQRPPGIPLRLSLGMQIGGAAGNLFDRLRMGQVTDFIDVGLWPVFNLADTSIVIGIAILVSVVLFDRRGDRRPEQVAYPGEGGTADGSGDVTGIGGTFDLGEVEGVNRGPVWDDPAVPMDDRGCPICDSAMATVPGGWRCYGCGAMEWLEVRGR